MEDEKFLRLCGVEPKVRKLTDIEKRAGIRLTNPSAGYYPPIDLNFLFQYRPKNIAAIYFDFELEAGETHVHLVMADGQSYWAISDIDKPEDALKEAIWKAFGGKK